MLTDFQKRKLMALFNQYDVERTGFWTRQTMNASPRTSLRPCAFNRVRPSTPASMHII